MHPVYRNLVRAKVQMMVDTARAVGALRNPTVKGSLRELVIRELLRPLLPSDVGVATGIVTDNDGHDSNPDHDSPQEDIVMFDRRVLPPALLEGTGVFPVESVLYTMEVKSQLTLEGLRHAEAGAAALDRMHMIQVRDQTTRALDPVAVVLAFGSDLSSPPKSELTRYLDLVGNQPPNLDAICVVGRGYWFWEQRKSDWEATEVDSPGYEYPHQEVVELVAGVMNTYPLLAASRGHPPLGWYLT